MSFAHVSPLKADAQLNTFSGPAFHLTDKAILEQCSVSDSNFILYALLIRPYTEYDSACNRQYIQRITDDILSVHRMLCMFL